MSRTNLWYNEYQSLVQCVSGVGTMAAKHWNLIFAKNLNLFGGIIENV